MDKYNVLVTGGAGFIGSHTVEKLAEMGHNAIVLDDLSTGKKENLNGIKCKFVEGNINNRSILKHVFTKLGKVDYVIHLAAKLSVPESMTNPALYQEVNVQGTYNILTYAHKCRCKKVALASTCAVEGDSYYGLSKKITEDISNWFTVNYKLPVACLRYVNVYGERQALVGEGAVVPAFIDLVKSSKQAIVHGDGSQTRDYVNVKDVAEANIHAVLNDFTGITYVATGIETSVIDLLKKIQDIVGIKIDPIYKDRRAGDMMSVGKHYPKKEFGWTPKVTLEEGLRKMITK
jgi:UDP-glucose 4-epimerase